MGTMHRRIPCLIAASLLVAGCDDNGATWPSSLPLVFSAVLNPANEVPHVANDESRGRGAAQITVNVTRDAAGAHQHRTQRGGAIRH